MAYGNKLCPLMKIYTDCEECKWYISTVIDDRKDCAFVIAATAIDNIDAHGIDVYDHDGD